MEITLKQLGYLIRGKAVINFWGGGQGIVAMSETVIPLGKLTKQTLLASVNDGGFGCESIKGAEIEIYDFYEDRFSKFNRSIIVDSRYIKDFCNWRYLE